MRLFAGTVAELLFNTFLSKRVLLIAGRATQTGFLPCLNMKGTTQSYRLFEAFSMICFWGCESVSVCMCLYVCVCLYMCKCVCGCMCVFGFIMFVTYCDLIYLLDVDFVCVCVIF